MSKTSKASKVRFEKAGNKTRRATGSGAQPFWYLERDEDLSVVTSGSSNEKLGITQIEVFQPTVSQEKIGVLCKVRLVTLCGIDDNISIFESRHTPGDIYLMMGGSKETGNKDASNKPVYYRDRKLNDAAKAQILSYVHTLIETEE